MTCRPEECNSGSTFVAYLICCGSIHEALLPLFSFSALHDTTGLRLVGLPEFVTCATVQAVFMMRWSSESSIFHT